PMLPERFAPDVAAARVVVDTGLREGRSWLDPLEVARLFAAYAIPVVPTVLARDPDEAGSAAMPFLATGGIVVKIQSRDIRHKSDIGGVQLNLTSQLAVREATAQIMARARARRSDARSACVP